MSKCVIQEGEVFLSDIFVLEFLGTEDSSGWLLSTVTEGGAVPGPQGSLLAAVESLRRRWRRKRSL